MIRFTLRRVLELAIVFFGVTFLIYAMVFALQGDPTRGPLQRARLIEEGVVFVDRKRMKVDMKAHQWRPKTRTVKKKRR